MLGVAFGNVTVNIQSYFSLFCMHVFCFVADVLFATEEYLLLRFALPLSPSPLLIIQVFTVDVAVLFVFVMATGLTCKSMPPVVSCCSHCL